MSSELPALTAAQAAARLGVKPATLYAYVSRGLLTRTRTAGGSLFDPLEVEAFARSRRPTSRPAADAADGHSPGTPLMAIDHDIALLEDDRLYFRGRPADELADSAGFETVAWWLWTRDLAARSALPADRRRRGRDPPRSARPADRDVAPAPAAGPGPGAGGDRSAAPRPVRGFGGPDGRRS